MSTLRRAIGNSAILLLSQGVTWTATLILLASLSRGLGDSGFGTIFLAMSFAVIFSVFVDFGLDQHLVRAVARDNSLAGPYLLNSLALKTGMAVVAYLLIVGIIHVLNYPSDVRQTIMVYTVVLLFNGYSTSLTSVYQGLERMFHSAVGTMIEKVSISAIAVALLMAGFGVVAIASVYVIGSLASVTWKAWHLRRLTTLELRFAYGTMRTLVIGGLPFFLYWSLASVYNRIDGILLSQLTDTAVVGWYAAGYRLFDTLVFLPNIIAASIMFPILSRLSVQSRDDLRRAAGKGLEIILILGIPICTGLFVLADPIIRFIYGGGEFLNGVPALRWLAVALLLLYVNSVMAFLLISLNREKMLSIIAVVAIVVNTGLNLLLIPIYQHVAAAAVTLVTEAMICVYFFTLIPKDVLSTSSLYVGAKAGVAAGLMALVLVLFSGQHLFVLVPLGMVTYGSACLVLRVVARDDVQLFRQAIMSRRSESPAGTTEVSRV
jgi:O-antigen/teichoic acid export membrane protein